MQPVYTVNLSWNSSSNVVGYNVYRGTSANGSYSRINSTVDANTAFTDSSVATGSTYYYAATSVNASGQESSLSTPVQVAVP
jgi:fibronectin type 3 domain-containing protein